MGTVAIGIGIRIGIGIGLGSVETVLHIFIEANFIGIGIGVSVGIGVGQWKHTTQINSWSKGVVLPHWVSTTDSSHRDGNLVAWVGRFTELHTSSLLLPWHMFNKKANWLYAELKSHISFHAKSHCLDRLFKSFLNDTLQQPLNETLWQPLKEWIFGGKTCSKLLQNVKMRYHWVMQILYIGSTLESVFSTLSMSSDRLQALYKPLYHNQSDHVSNYRSGTVNSNMVNSKFHLIRSCCQYLARFLSFHV